MTAALHALTKKYFGDLGPDVVDTMYQIALRESGGNPDAYNGRGLDNSYGLWQINVHPQANPDLAGMDLNDPEQNARAARIIYDRQGPQAWSTYGAAMQEPMSTYNWQGEGGGGGPANGLDTQTFLNGILSAMPKPGQYKDVTDASGTYTAAQQYQDDYADWLENYKQALTVAQLQEEMGAGLTRMQDGTIVSQADFAMLDPAAQAQVQARQAQVQIDLDNAWADIVNTYGLTEFQTKQGAIQSENARRSTEFQNRMSEFDTRLGLDQMNQDTAAKQVDRQLSGMQESRGRAGLIQDAMDKAAGWATSGGKKSFTPADLGEAMKVIAQFGGIGANTPFLNFTGTRTIDPQALLTAQDEALGVSGQLPQIPNLLTQPGQIPQAPGTMPVPLNPPQMLYPQAPAQMPISQPQQRPRTLSEILGMPGF